MDGTKVDWSPIFREAWDETPTLRPRYTVGPLAVTILAQVFAWLAGASVQAVVTNAIVFGLTAWLVVSVIWFATNLVRVPAHQLAVALHTNAAHETRLILEATRAPKLTITDADARPQDAENFYLFVDVVNPGDPTTLNKEWNLDVVKADGTKISGLRGSTPFHGILESGRQYDARVVFQKGEGIPTAGALLGARYTLTVSDIHDHTLRGTYPPNHV
jgi:hypothetical protein